MEAPSRLIHINYIFSPLYRSCDEAKCYLAARNSPTLISILHTPFSAIKVKLSNFFLVCSMMILAL
jgi:hypothetical protein